LGHLPPCSHLGKAGDLLEICSKKIRIKGWLIRIASLDAEGYQFLKDPEAALGVLRESGIRIDLFTFIQKLSDTTRRYNYPMELDNLAALRISTFDDWMTHQIHFKVRNKIRKASKNGVSVREVPLDDALLRGIHAVYNESPTRQGKAFWHYGKDHETIRTMMEAFLDRTIFLGAFYQGSLIGFAQLVTDEDRNQAGLMQILSMIQHRDKAPTNALIAQAVRSCAERGISHLWYANMSYGKKQADSLANFKLHNGFEKIELPRYYVPMTVVGFMALRMGLHRSMADWIPEPVAATYRRIRNLWYARRFPGPENAQ
jgi:hypothetical protein